MFMPRGFACGLLMVLATVAGSEGGQADPPVRKLNVLFIVSDDLNSCLHCYGHPTVRSPHIDRLAARGVLFQRAYCQFPLCNPSRTSFLSGRRPDATGVFTNAMPPRTQLKDVVFLPEHFHQHGYFSARVGKIAHERFEDAVTWDVSEMAEVARPAVLRRPPGERANPGIARGGEGQMQPLVWEATPNSDADEPDGRTARSIARLMERNRDKPFFIAAGFHKPHLPFVAPKKYFDLYPPENVSLPQEPADVRKSVPAIAFVNNPADDRLTAAQRRQAIAAYYACVSFVDAQVGVLLDTLDRLHLWDDTVVVFFGDHGFHLGEHGNLWRKRTLFEESVRVPLIVAVPGKKAGAVSPRLVEFVDLYPTLTELCGLKTPDGLEGTSFAPLLDDPQRPWKKAAFTQVNRPGNVMGRTVRNERYRYTEWGSEDRAELYDHDSDPHEYINLVRDSKHAAIVADMRRLLHDGWRKAQPPRTD
jgi:uncharacterized sulfatase